MSVRARVMMKYWEESDEETGQSQPVQIANYGLDNESIDGQSQAFKMETSPNTGSGVPLEGNAQQNIDNPSLAPGSQPAVNKRGASNGHVSASSPLETRCGSAVGKGRVCSTQDVCCPCGLQQVYGLMIMCCICGHWQHGVCFKVFDEESLSAHVCHVCAKASSDNKPTDPSLCGLSASASRNTCLWRRALLLAYELAEFEPWEFSETLGVDSCLTNRLLKRLEKEQFVSIDDKSDRQIKLVVDKRKLTAEGFPKYLESTTLRIVMETPEEQRENNEVATVVKETPMMENLVRKTGGMNITQKSLKDVSNLNESQPDSTSESVMKRPKAAPKRRGKRKELDAEVMSSQDSVQVSKRQKASIAKTPLNFNV